MTLEELYDLALTLGVKDPAVVWLGEQLVVGEWVPLAECEEGLILRSVQKAIRPLVRATNVEEAESRIRGWRAQNPVSER